MPKRSVQVEDHEANIIMMGIGRLQSEAKKLGRTADLLESKELKESSKDYLERLEALKNRFL